MHATAALGYTEEERPTACATRLTCLRAPRGNINMSYVPNVTAVYLRAFSGFMSGIDQPGASAASNSAEMADSWAQAVDTAWGVNPVTSLELRAIDQMSQSIWSGRSPLENSVAFAAGNYQAEAIAVVVAAQAANAEVVEEGINPNDPVSGTPYSLFFALMPGDNAATVAVGAPVAFPQNGPTSAPAAANRADNFTFTLPNTGDYEVDCQVSVSEAGQLQLALGGVGLPDTVAGRATGTSQIVISTIIHATAGQVLSVINPAGNSTALTITPIAGGTHSVSATLKIKQVG